MRKNPLIPLVIGLGDDANYIGSDVLSFLPYTKKVIYLNEGEALLSPAKM